MSERLPVVGADFPAEGDRVETVQSNVNWGHLAGAGNGSSDVGSSEANIKDDGDRSDAAWSE